MKMKFIKTLKGKEQAIYLKRQKATKKKKIENYFQKSQQESYNYSKIFGCFYGHQGLIEAQRQLLNREPRMFSALVFLSLWNVLIWDKSNTRQYNWFIFALLYILNIYAVCL